ncbi:hypothetical protein N9164_12175 [Draconibacterium sp.]|nr:hypothetical protein [Draconibacterium sp.]
MKKVKNPIGLLILFLSIFVQTGFSQTEALGIVIDVAPAVLNLNNQGEVVTVHTDIAYNLVTASTVSLNGVDINSWKADDRGNFVAKFLMNEIKDLDLNIGGMNTLVLTGETSKGIAFQGVQEIKVINVIPAGKK